MLQQRLTDMKKTLQRELKSADPGGGGGGGGGGGVGGEVNTNHHTATPLPPPEDDVNFKYLKHVLIKFLTCRDYEVNDIFIKCNILLSYFRGL